MKKNISVNLFGTLYNIDEDAYTLLQKYEESVRLYFQRKGEDDEVAQDIERRVAELFEELRQQGIAAITIEHMQDIIRRIGEPGEMDGEGTAEAEEPKAEEPAATDETQQSAPRKLYRDADDCMLGGVLAGLAHYLGGSVTAVRLLFVIVALLVASIPWLIVFYIVCCILIPKASTPEDKLRMMGKPVNLVSLGEGVINGASEDAHQEKNRGCVGQMLGFVAMMFKIALFMCFGFVAFIVGIMIFAVLCALLAGLAAAGSIALFDHPSSWLFPLLDLPGTAFGNIDFNCFWLMIVCAILFLGLPLYAVVHIYRRVRSTEQPWSTATCIAVWLLWILSAILMACFGHGTLKGIESKHFNYRFGPNFHITRTVTTNGVSVIDDCIDDADSDAVSAVSDSIF